jgi:hypothetical protein
MAEAIVRYLISEHAIGQMRRRGLAPTLIAGVLMAPQRRMRLWPGRDALQSLIMMDGRRYLVRIIGDVDRNPPVVVTAFRTSKIDKYWKAGP